VKACCATRGVLEAEGLMHPALRKARGEAAALSKQFQDRCGQRLWVQSVVAWWGDVAGGGKLGDGDGVVQGEDLADRLRAQKGRPVPQFDQVAAVLQPGRHTREARPRRDRTQSI